MRQTPARRKLRDSSGSQLSDLFMVVSVLVALVAVELGYFMRYRHAEEIRSLGCFENLLRIERGAEAHELTVPS